jgi:hypothetical protein
MYMMLSIIGAVAAASAQSPQVVTPPPVDASKKICRMIVPTGSIMAKRICLTKPEWNEMTDLTQESADTFMRRRQGTGMCDESSQCAPVPRGTLR